MIRYTLLSIFSFLLLSFSPSSKLEHLTIQPDASKIEWFAEKITGKHNGTVQLKEGYIDLKDGKLVGGQFVVDMTSIEVTDLSGEMKEKLTRHLHSEDFFHTDKYKVATMVITGSEPGAGDAYDTQILSNMTIKGTYQPVHFPAKVVIQDGKFAAVGEIIIDRTKFDIRYGSESFFEDLGDRAISDEFRLKVSIGAKI